MLLMSMTLKPDFYTTCLPQTEDLLKNTEYQKALKLVTKGKRPLRMYRGIIDFLCCELFPSEKEACMAYYKEEGPLLVEIRSKKRLEFIDNYIVLALTIAHEARKQKLQMEWKEYLEAVEGYALLAAA